MSRLTRDGTAEPASRDQILGRERGQGNIHFPVQLTTSRIGNLIRLINVCMYVLRVCHPIYSGRQGCGRTSRGLTGGRSHRISPRFFCGACLDFSREKDSAVPSPRRP